MWPQNAIYPSMKDCVKIGKSIGLMYHRDKIKKQNHMIALIDTEKALKKNKTSFMITTLSKLGIEGNLNLIKNSYKTTTATTNPPQVT